MYKKGVDNRVADALSRKSSHEATCAAISSCQPQWISEVLNGYQQDEVTLSILAKLTIAPNTVPHFTLSEGVLRYKSRIWIGDNKLLQLKLMSACHASALGGHSGVPVTYSRMKKLFAWRGMKKDVSQFVRTCLVCQPAKPDRAKLPGLLQPLQVPDHAWQIISLDFVEGLHNLAMQIVSL